MESLDGYERVKSYVPITDGKNWYLCKRCNKLPRIMEDEMTVSAKCPTCGREIGMLKAISSITICELWNSFIRKKNVEV